MLKIAGFMCFVKFSYIPGFAGAVSFSALVFTKSISPDLPLEIAFLIQVLYAVSETILIFFDLK